MQTKIQSWGDSLGLRTPRALTVKAGVGPGSEVDLSIPDGDLVVRPARRRKYRLCALLRKVTVEDVHAEVDAGGTVGREVWQWARHSFPNGAMSWDSNSIRRPEASRPDVVPLW